jgi:magnesium chelatase subunit I
MEELVAELTHMARRSPEISQRSGVSVRVSVANAEVLEAAALKRAVRLGEPVAAPRISDLGALVASTVGKVELESVGDESPEERVVERLITKALHATFGRHASVDALEPVIEAFEDGFTIETGDRKPSREYVAWMREVPGLGDAVRGLGAFDVTDGAEEPAVVASAVEFLLEGLHLARRLNKDRIPGGTVYHR